MAVAQAVPKEVKLRADREVRCLGEDNYEVWGECIPGATPSRLAFGRGHKIRDWLVYDALNSFGKELEAQASALIREAEAEADADTDQPVSA